MIVEIPGQVLSRLAREALAEDLGPGDLTTDALIAPDARCVARITAGEPLTVSGLNIAAACFLATDSSLAVTQEASEGSRLARGDGIMSVSGLARPILAAERVSLNFLGRLSGIATLTRACVDAVAGTGARIVDTRKTTPGLRILERQAVRAGGGMNHRFGLFDAILVKDNHRTLRTDLVEAVRALRAAHGGHCTIGVEVEDLETLTEILDAGADLILLDNMTPERVRDAVRMRDAHTGPRAALEASGGITLDTVAAVAASGVDRIAMGALTHGARSVDVSLHLTPTPRIHDASR